MSDNSTMVRLSAPWISYSTVLPVLSKIFVLKGTWRSMILLGLGKSFEIHATIMASPTVSVKIPRAEKMMKIFRKARNFGNRLLLLCLLLKRGGLRSAPRFHE